MYKKMYAKIDWLVLLRKTYKARFSLISFFVLNKRKVIDFFTFFWYITNYIEKRTIKLPNAISDVIDLNWLIKS